MSSVAFASGDYAKKNGNVKKPMAMLKLHTLIILELDMYAPNLFPGASV